MIYEYVSFETILISHVFVNFKLCHKYVSIFNSVGVHGVAKIIDEFKTIANQFF